MEKQKQTMARIEKLRRDSEVLKELETLQEKKVEKKRVEVMEKRLEDLRDQSESVPAKKEEKKEANVDSDSDALAELQSALEKLQKENKTLEKKLRTKTKQAEKYQSFLQEKLVPLQQGKEAYEKAAERYKELEE